jgi:hypothetical protein
MRGREHEKGVPPTFFKLPVEQFADEGIGRWLGDEQAGRDNSKIEKRLKESKLSCSKWTSTSSIWASSSSCFGTTALTMF